MLIVEPPSQQSLLKLLRGLVTGHQDRRTVCSWQQALVSQYGWHLPLTVAEGYWYFYSLGFLLDTAFNGQLLLRDQDLYECSLDLEGKICRERNGAIYRFRPHQRPGQSLMWPLFEGPRYGDDLSYLGFESVRGIFEKSHGVVEQITLELKGEDFLIVTHPDDPNGKVYVLGGKRRQSHLPELVDKLGLSQ